MSAEEKRESLAEFIARIQIEMKATPTAGNPHFEDSPDVMSHWLCVFSFFGRGAEINSRRFRVVFSMGSAHRGAPKIASVLDCLASDSQGLENGTFEDWASECGYDIDSRRAEKIYETIQRQARELKKFFGASDFEKLLYHIERE